MPARKQPLSEARILLWADAHRRTGNWPTAASGPAAGAPPESWSAVASALYAGNRGLPGGGTLPRLLRRHGRGGPRRGRRG
jgi:hypothetical protein